jgi:hypothetical protein
MRPIVAFVCFAALVFGQPRQWTPLSPSGPNSEPVLARAKDGALHLVWQENASLKHAALEAITGKSAGPPHTIVPAGPAALAVSKLLALPDGSLHLIFTGSTAAGLQTAISKDAGKTWETAPGPQASLKEYARAAAAADREGKPVLAFRAAPGKIVWQSGLGASQPLETVREGPCCVPYADIALDAESAEGWVAWRLQSARESGLFVKAVKPASGAVVAAPGSADAASTSPSPSLSPRLGAPGVYLAYCAGSPPRQQIKLWNVRGGEALTVARAPGARNVLVAPAPEGRLWVLWTAAANTVWGVRSNKALTRFSRPYALGQPRGPARALAAEASTGPLDLLAGGAHLRVYPELELRGGSDGITFLDVGDPVEGVDVEIDGKSVKTGANGMAPYAGTFSSVKATHAGYAPFTFAILRPPLRSK